MECEKATYTVTYEVIDTDGEKKEVREVKTLAEIVVLVKQLEPGQTINVETETTDEAKWINDLIRSALNKIVKHLRDSLV